MDFDALDAAIFAWVRAIVGSGVTVIWDEPDKPKPPNPSIRLSYIQPPSMIGDDDLRPSNSSRDSFRIVGPRQFVLSISSYGEEAYKTLFEIQTANSDPTLRELLSSGNISILSSTRVMDLTAMMETTFEKRGSLDFTMLTTIDKVIVPGAIESLEVSGEVGEISIESEIVKP